MITVVLTIPFLLHPLQKENNDFYDNTPLHKLKGPDICVEGEILNPGKTDLSRLPLRSVMIREARIGTSGQVDFIGSYRYDGYSLFDILKERCVNRSNKSEFGSVIDMLVVVENDQGEKAVFSWGEIYYPTVLHRIILATKVARIIPSKTKEEWPLPVNRRLVCANDLLSERNLERPIKIRVISCPLRFSATKAKPKPPSGKINLIEKNRIFSEITHLDDQLSTMAFPSVFYGRGRGFHGIKDFRGKILRAVLKPHFGFDREKIRSAYFAIAASDGYRIVVSFSELFNRNDQADFLIIDQGKSIIKGRFRLFPTPDFFSDRAIYNIDSIQLLTVN